MDLKSKFLSLCMPAQIYLLLALLSCILALFGNINFLAIAIKLIFAIIWTLVLNYICKSGYEGVSWFLVVFPYVLILLLILGLVKFSK